MQLKNIDVQLYLRDIIEAFFADDNKHQQYLPVKLNFALQKNLILLMQHNNMIENSQKEICERYGILEDDHYTFSNENISVVEQEMSDLDNITIELPILMVDIDTINDLQLTVAQMHAIMFMVKNEKE